MLAITIPIPTDSISPIQDLGLFTSNVVGAILTLAAIAALIYMVLGGVEWILAGGDKGKVEEARHRVTNAVIGLAIAATAWAVFLLADYFLGLNLAGQKSDLTLPSSPAGSSSSVSGGGATKYVRVKAGTPCGSGNPKGFSYDYNCPVQCAGNTTEDCRGL